MSVLKSLQRQYKALESELKRIKEKIEIYNEEIPRIEEEMAELAEIIGILSQLPRYQEENQKKQKQYTDSVPQNGGEENANQNSVD